MHNNIFHFECCILLCNISQVNRKLSCVVHSWQMQWTRCFVIYIICMLLNKSFFDRFEPLECLCSGYWRWCVRCFNMEWSWILGGGRESEINSSKRETIYRDGGWSSDGNRYQFCDIQFWINSILPGTWNSLSSFGLLRSMQAIRWKLCKTQTICTCLFTASNNTLK